MAGLLVGLTILLGFAGIVLPVPSLILSLREFLKVRLTPPVRIWRRAVSRVTLILFCLGAVLWIYAAIRQVRGDYSYTELSAAVGRSYSAGLIVPSAIAESKLRRYLFLGAVGLFLFFAVSIGEWTI